MTRVLLLLSLPCLLWTQPPDSASTLKSAGITQVCVPPESADAWKALGLGFTVTPLSADALKSREALLVPGIAPRAGQASPTRSPWVNANGWRYRRNPAASYAYDVPAGRAALAAAEAFAYGAKDAVLKIDPADVPALGAMLTFLQQVPAADYPDVADLAVVDDGGPLTGEVMNLLSRRNLLFRPVKAAAESKQKVTIQLGTPAYPQAEAANPSDFALKVRRQLTDDLRSLRVYGAEVVIGRLTSNGTKARLHLLNYGGRDIEGLRIRVRGRYTEEATLIAGTGAAKLDGLTSAGDTTEFSLPRISTYAIVDLSAAK